MLCLSKYYKKITLSTTTVLSNADMFSNNRMNDYVCGRKLGNYLKISK